MGLSVAFGGERFSLRPDPPASLVPDLLDAVRLDGEGRRRYRTASLLRLLAGLCDGDDEGDRLAAWMLAPRRALPDRTLADAAMWAVEQVTGRPFGQAAVLAAVAHSDLAYLRGHALMSGGRPDEWTLPDLLDACWADLIDRAAPTVGRAKAAEQVADALLVGWPDRETWGLGTAGEQLAAAMMDIPPAIPRQENA